MAKFISKLKNISKKFGSTPGTQTRKSRDLPPQTGGDRPGVDHSRPTVLPGTPLSLAPGEQGKPLGPRAIASNGNPSDPGKPSKGGKPRRTILSTLKRLWVNPGGKPLYRRRIFWVGLGVVAVSSTAGTLTWVGWRIDRSLPDVSEVFTFVRDGTLTITTQDGTILQQIGPATRDKLRMQDIPEPLVEAFIASEDSRFYQHGGVDYQGVLRATVANILAREVVEGGSTITQQLARMVFLTQEQTAGRKIREAFLARKIEQNMRKQQILERYLNYVYLGSGAYGIADAAWVYFSKSVDELTLSEMAMIAGLPPAPSVYSPLVNPENARIRRNIVLQRMTELGYITPEDAATAREQTLEVQASSPKRLKVEAPYFTSYIQKELPKLVSKEALEMGGLTVQTTINLEWQRIAEKVVKEAAELDGPAQGFDQAALVAIAPDTGEIKAMVGGRSFEESEFNRVTQAQRQPGSTFKGFVYAAAIAAGWSPYDGYEDANFRVDGYKPRNYGGKYRGWVSMVDALTNSINVVAVKVLIDIGFEPTIELAKNMGIKSKLDPIYSLALGGSEVNLLELTSAYGTIAAEGKYHETHGITRIIDRRGKTIYQGKSQPKQALDQETSAIVTWMLEPVVQYGTGSAARLGNRPVAGKTGTSDEARDLWFIGYIPQLVTGVWLGNDDSYPTWGSSSTAAFTWRQFMEQVVEGMPVEDFPDIPDRFDGREKFLKTKPVIPNSIFYGDTTPDNAQSGSANAGHSWDGYY